MSLGFILTLGENQLFRGVFLGNQVRFVASVTVVAWGCFPKYLRPYELNMSLEYVMNSWIGCWLWFLVFLVVVLKGHDPTIKM